MSRRAAIGAPRSRPRWRARRPQGCSASTSTSRRWFRSACSVTSATATLRRLTSDAEKRAYEQVAFATYHRGYGVIQGTRPQTIGYSLADTPVGLAAWLLDHDTTTYQHLAQLFAGHPYGAITRDDWLDNTSLYWLTNTPTSAARLYWQQAVTGKNFYAAADISLPAAVTVFPEEYVHAPRSWTEQAYHNLIYFHEPDRGGHFAAWEQPQLFAEEMRASFRTLR